MEAALSALAGLFFTVAIYLLLSRHVVRMLLGLVIFGNAVNLLIFAAGRIVRDVPPLVPEGLSAPAAAVANPLPQALILTAIVISFSFFAVLLVLAYRTYQTLGEDDTDRLRVAEPAGETLPPMGY